MCVLDMALQMVLAGERLVAAGLGASEWSLLAMAPLVGFEAAWPIKALTAALEGADVVPRATSLAVCPQRASVGIIDLVVVGRVI